MQGDTARQGCDVDGRVNTCHDCDGYLEVAAATANSSEALRKPGGSCPPGRTPHQDLPGSKQRSGNEELKIMGK